MLAVALGTLLLTGQPQLQPGQPARFEQIEEEKFRAYSNLPSFRGTYVMVTLPSEGVGMRQAIEMVLSGSGRRVKVLQDGQPVVETGWTSKSRWTANHMTRQYVLEEPEGGLELKPAFKPLFVEPGRVNVQLNEMGPRFAADPNPQTSAPTLDTVDGRRLHKYVATARTPDGSSTVVFTQWFDEGTWIVRRFELEKSTSDGRSQIVGFLSEENFKAPIALADFMLPTDIAGKYQRISGSNPQ
jgi:hypothetical protein